MTPTIVIAVEQSNAERIARIGGELAEDLGARVVLAHIRPDPPFNSSTQWERTRHRSRRRGAEILYRAYAALPQSVDADMRIELGGVVSRLGEIAAEVGAALIVVGSPGRGRLASALFGSVSQALARQAPCPVMIVPDAAPMGSPRPIGDAPRERATIVVGVEGSEQRSPAADFAWAVAERLGDRLMVVRPHAAGDPPASALRAISAGEDARMIVVDGEDGDRARLGRATSLAAGLPRAARCPVVVVPEGATATLPGVSEAHMRRAA